MESSLNSPRERSTTLRSDEDLFAGAVALPATERIHYLRRACGSDLSAFNRLSTLIHAFDDSAALFADGCIADAGELDSFRLLRELGEGGCGVAYLAEQLKPVRRQVAVKVIKPGMDTRAVIARFEAERQVLALMDHPHVAKVFDAGSTSTGRPYFVMELVRGIRITDYCNQTRRTIAERLRLFIQVCQAIQHAHQKGIIHRDIKPSNVMVTMHDGLPLAKVIDFGIAKATQGRLVDQTYTTVNYFVGTPEYVSPEQTELNSELVDTRSDIYSLGVLLYELLTGCTPFESEELRGRDIDHMRQHIRTQEPARPSRRLLEAGSDYVRNMSACTGMPAARVLAQVRGDLDWIVMRCLEKDPVRRYQGVTDVISELQRYLQHEPIEARPPQLTYIAVKFARRNRAMFAAVFATVVVAIAFVTNMSIQARRVAAERDRAEQEVVTARIVAEFMERLFEGAQPERNLGKPIFARDLLEEGGRRIRGDLNQRPEVRARLLEAIGRSYRRLDLSVPAVQYLEDALHIRKQLPDPDGMRIATTLLELGLAVRKTGDLQRADSLFTEALQISKRHHGERSETYAKLLMNIGRVHLVAGNLTEARQDLEASHEMLKSLFGPLHPDVGDAAVELSSVFMWQDDLIAAEKSAREAVDIFAATQPPMHPDRVAAEIRWAQVLQLQNRISEAADLFENSLVAQTQLYGADSLKVAEVLESLAAIKKAQGQLPEAEDYARRALQIQERTSGPEHTVTAYERIVLASILVKRANYKEAEQQVRRALATFSKNLPADHQYVASAEHIYGEVLLETGRLNDAEAVLTSAIHRWKRSDAPAWRVARSESALGEALFRQGRTTDAERYLVASFRELAADDTADGDARIKARERITRFYTGRGEHRKLKQLMLATSERASAHEETKNN